MYPKSPIVRSHSNIFKLFILVILNKILTHIAIIIFKEEDTLTFNYLLVQIYKMYCNFSRTFLIMFSANGVVHSTSSSSSAAPWRPISSTGSASSTSTFSHLDPRSFEYAEAAFALLTEGLNKLRQEIWISLQCEPLGYTSLDTFIEDFIEDFHYNPEERCREFGYDSLCAFLYSDYMRKHARTHYSPANGQIYFCGIPDETTEDLFVTIMASHLNKQIMAKQKQKRMEKAAKRAKFQQQKSQPAEGQQATLTSRPFWQRSYP